MGRMVWAAAVILLSQLPAQAALPPQYQRQAELAAIIADPAIADAFGFDGISSIQYVGTDLYRLQGGNCTLEVRIEDLPKEHPEGWAGPREFTIVRGEPVCQ
jgi:hypothetical protein